MTRLLYLLSPLFFLGFADAQPNLTCIAANGSPLVRLEGLTERTGDIVLTCSGGTPGAQISGNLTLFLSANITNRVASNSNLVSDVVFTADSGSGPQPISAPGMLTGFATLVYNNVAATLSPAGSIVLRLANVRVAANQMPDLPNSPVTAQLSFHFGSNVSLTTNQFKVATAERGLFGAFSSKIVCVQSGSPLPDDVASLSSFLHSRATFNTTRLTEGFADAFGPRGDFQGLNAAAGTRFIVRYGGFPKGARLFVPTAIAGSDAVEATAGGDFGRPASGGKYAPGGNGSLLLSLVQGADSTGSGGVPIFSPGAPGSGTVSLDAMSELGIVNGSATAVYEVMDADPFVQENAQFPTFVGLAPFTGTPATTTEDVSFAPLSTVAAASSHDPIPRFQQMTPPPDCTLVGDCSANYFPVLFVPQNSLQFTATAGSSFQVGYLLVQNQAGGIMHWTVTIKYQNGSGWLRVDPTDGVNNQGIRVDALPDNLAAGTYKAILTIDAGPLAGSRDIPITLTITPAPPLPAVTSVLHAATFAAGPVAPGSIATVMGSLFSGSALGVTFDGTPGQILFSNDTQLNVVVPASLGSKASAQLVVSANGLQSKPFTVPLAPFAPGIFAHGILNQDYTVNDPAHPAPLGSIIQIFATGLSGNGAITAKLGGQVISQPYYAGPAPGLPGVQQVDLILPTNLASGTASVSVCGGTTPDQAVCSPAVDVTLAQ